MNYLIPIIAAFIISYSLTPLVIFLAKKYKLVDDARVRFHPAHTHVGIIPRAGGLALFLGVTIPLLFFLPVTKIVLGILAGSFLLMIIGLIDDKQDISPYVRIITNAVAALLVIGSGVGIPFITNPFTGNLIHLNTWRLSFTFFGPHSILVWADILAFVWIMWTVNIIGWSAGVDGQMPGFVAISAFVLGLLSLRFSAVDATQIPVTILAFIVCGAFCGFLPWNFYPQKIMPGYGGKTLSGYYLAILAILSYGKLGTALLVLGIPIIDALVTLVRRIGKGKSPVLADRGHLHHHLLDLGWGKRRIALSYWIFSAILGAIALSVTSKQKIFTFLVVAVVVGGFLLWVRLFTQLSKPQDQDNG